MPRKRARRAVAEERASLTHSEVMEALVVTVPPNKRLVRVKPVDDKWEPGRMVVPNNYLGQGLRVVGRRVRVRKVLIEPELYELVQ